MGDVNMGVSARGRRFFAAIFLFVSGIASAAEHRVALVIGNSTYLQSPLKNPVNDARAMATRLRAMGFEVLLRENVKVREIGGIYREFRSRIKPGGAALFFYAGHGQQFKGQNYFPAVDSVIDGEEDVALQSINLNLVLDNMEEAKAGVSLALLDACRDNPFSRRFRGGARGLAQVETASGTLIHYATKPGSVAADGTGANGTYTEALLEYMDTPGVPIELLLKRVTNKVVSQTRGQQEPWIEGSLRGDFYFRPAAEPGAGGLNAVQDSSRIAAPAPTPMPPLALAKAAPPLSVTANPRMENLRRFSEHGREWLLCEAGMARAKGCPLSERKWIDVEALLKQYERDGWRLPSREEFRGLKPFIGENPEVGRVLGASRFWSSDPIERIRDRMWGYSLTDNDAYPLDKSQLYPVIFVRDVN